MNWGIILILSLQFLYMLMVMLLILNVGVRNFFSTIMSGLHGRFRRMATPTEPKMENLSAWVTLSHSAPNASSTFPLRWDSSGGRTTATQMRTVSSAFTIDEASNVWGLVSLPSTSPSTSAKSTKSKKTKTSKRSRSTK